MPFHSLHDLDRYAQAAVKIGLNLQPGQRLLVGAPIEAAPLVRLVTTAAYDAGARLVSVLWNDEQLGLIRFQHAPRDSFEEYPTWYAHALIEHVERGDAYLNIAAQDPALYAGQDPELIAIAQKTAGKHLEPYLAQVTRNTFNWTLVSYPIASWADRMFPDAPAAERVDRLWNAILFASRLTSPDPIAGWQKHIADLERRRDFLTRKQYRALHLTGPGTDLTIGMAPDHLWLGGAMQTTRGLEFTPNLPTEEVFSLPHKDRTEGIVRASKPLSYAGTLIEGFSLTFKQGRVVQVEAKQGEAVLRNLIETDEGAARLGEIALVPASSPISQIGLMFYNTLFDENAASHIALGRSYAFTLRGSAAMSPAELAQAGANNSLVHVDFMIGSAEMNIDGITAVGGREPVMREGEWAVQL
ncbi:MAG: aminopeptidase [Anaerolineae bacterium]